MVDKDRFQTLLEEMEDGEFSNRNIPKSKFNLLDSTAPPITKRLRENCYFIPRSTILASLSREYRTFLGRAGYGNLTTCSGIQIGKKLLEFENGRELHEYEKISRAASRGTLTYDKIDHYGAKHLLEERFTMRSRGKVLTVGLMYNLFLPYIKRLAEEGSLDAQSTIEEMRRSSEWLEDRVSACENCHEIRIAENVNKRVTSGIKKIDLPPFNHRYGGEDINEFGYPKEKSYDERHFDENSELDYILCDNTEPEKGWKRFDKPVKPNYDVYFSNYRKLCFLDTMNIGISYATNGIRFSQIV